MSRTRRDPFERFWEKVAKKGDNDCWEWTATKNQQGYGMFIVNGGESPWQAHRLAYKYTYGAVPEGMHILHGCDNPSCVNPKHLHPGTRSDNMKEAFARKRFMRQNIDLSEKEKIELKFKQICKKWGLADFEVEIIAKMPDNGFKKKDLMDQYKIPKHVIDQIRNLKKGIVPKVVPLF